MSYPVPNSDDPSLVDGKEEKILRGWDLLIYKCRQQPLVPLGNLSFVILVRSLLVVAQEPLRPCSH